MLVRLTFVKRYTYGGMLYRTERVYDVDESEAQRLCNVTVNDMPVFKVILPTQVGEKEKIIDLTSKAVEKRALEDEADHPEETAAEMETRFKAEAAANKKALAEKKKAEKPKAAPQKLAVKVPEKDANVDMVE